MLRRAPSSLLVISLAFAGIALVSCSPKDSARVARSPAGAGVPPKGVSIDGAAPRQRPTAKAPNISIEGIKSIQRSAPAISAETRRAIQRADFNGYGEGTYAVELEFTNDELDKASYDYDWGDGTMVSGHANEVNDAARAKLVRAVRDMCKKQGDCEVQAIRGAVSWAWGDGTGGIDENFIEAYRVKYKNGYTYEITLDVGVIEIKIGPMTPRGFEKGESKLDSLIQIAKRQGLNLNKGEMHLHEGISSNFKNEILAIRNRAVDRINNQQFAHLFAETLANTPPLASLPKDRYAKFAEIVRMVDEGLITDPLDFYKLMRRNVYDITLDESWVTDWESSTKFQDFNVTRARRKMDGEPFPAFKRTHEYRAMPGAQSARDVTNVVNLESARTRYLTSRPDRIKLLRFDPNSPWAHNVAMFKRYVEEAAPFVTGNVRFTFEDFKHLIPEEFRNLKLPELPPTVWEGSGMPNPADKCAKNLRRVLRELVVKGPVELKGAKSVVSRQKSRPSSPRARSTPSEAE